MFSSFENVWNLQFWASSHYSKHTKGVRNHSQFEGADWWWIVWIYRNHHQVLQVAGLSWRPKLEIRWEHVRESTESTESTQPSIDFMHFVVYLRLSRLHVLTESDPDLTEGPHWHPWSQWLTDVTQDFMPLPNLRWVLENHAKPLHLPFPSFPSFPHLIYRQVIPPISLVISRWIFESGLPKPDRTWSKTQKLQTSALTESVPLDSIKSRYVVLTWRLPGKVGHLGHRWEGWRARLPCTICRGTPWGEAGNFNDTARKERRESDKRTTNRKKGKKGNFANDHWCKSDGSYGSYGYRSDRSHRSPGWDADAEDSSESFGIEFFRCGATFGDHANSCGRSSNSKTFGRSWFRRLFQWRNLWNGCNDVTINLTWLTSTTCSLTASKPDCIGSCITTHGIIDCLYGFWFCSSDSWWNSIDPCSSRWSRSSSYFCCQTFGSTVDGNSRFCKEDVQFKISWSSSNCFLTWWPSILIGYLWSTCHAHVGFELVDTSRLHSTKFVALGAGRTLCGAGQVAGEEDMWKLKTSDMATWIRFFFSVCFSTSKFLRTIIWLLFEKGNQCNSRYQSASRSKRHVWEINMRNISIELGTWAFESKQLSNLATRKFQQTYEKVARHGLPLKWLHSERMWSMLSFYWTDGWQRPWEIQIVTVEFHSAILCFWTLCFKHIWIACNYGIISIDDINGIYYGGLASSDTGYSW